MEPTESTISAQIAETDLITQLSLSSPLAGLLLIPLSILVALAVNFILRRWLKQLAQKTPALIDDIAVEAIRKPLFWTLIFAGIMLSLIPLHLSDSVSSLITRALLSISIWMWTQAGVNIVDQFIKEYQKKLDEEKEEKNGVNVGRLAFVGKVIKITVYSIGIIIILLVWGLNLSPILASAGIFAAALTIAAQDSVSNLVGGISVIATQPYKVGDYIDLNDHRGEVTEIGMYNTRVKTNDNILITVPNSLMVTDAVINETGFDSKLRLRIPIGVAYGSDLNKIEKVLLDLANKRKDILKKPGPSVRYREFGSSAIKVELRVVISKPAWKGRITHELIKDIEKRFEKEKIVISPPSQQEIFIKEQQKNIPT